MSGPQSPNFDTSSPESVYEPYYRLNAELLRALQESPRGDALTYGATPLDMELNADDQAIVRMTLRKMTTEAPDTIPLEIISHVQDTFEERFNNRSKANDENFKSSLRYEQLDELEPDERELVTKAIYGQASPAELILVRDILGMSSIELACLTHIYGEHINDILPTMRDAVHYGVVVFDGEYYQKPQERFRVKEVILDGDSVDAQPLGFVMTRKRTIGRLPDGTIIRERSSFILRTDKESELYAVLGPFVARELNAMLLLSGENQDEAMAESESLGIIMRLLDTDKFDEAIPISTTIYAYNPKTEKRIRKAGYAKVVRQNEESPVLRAARNEFISGEF
jgi:hypothetical protein